jgi:hypothetical protein
MRTTSGKAAKWILLGCGGALLLGVLLVGGCFALLIGATKPAVETSERFLTAMAAGDAAAAKKDVAPEVAAVLDSALAERKAFWGKEWSISGRSVHTNNGRTTGEVTVSLKGTDGSTRNVVLTLTGTPDWKVAAVRVDGKLVLPIDEAAGLRITSPTFRVSGDATEGWKVFFDLRADGATKAADGQIKVTEGVSIHGPKGNELFRKDHFKTLEGKADWVSFTNDFTIPAGEGAGKYVFAFTVTDGATKAVARWTQEIDLK